MLKKLSLCEPLSDNTSQAEPMLLQASSHLLIQLLPHK
jgi:hypothetical protein